MSVLYARYVLEIMLNTSMPMSNVRSLSLTSALIAVAGTDARPQDLQTTL